MCENCERFRPTTRAAVAFHRTCWVLMWLVLGGTALYIVGNVVYYNPWVLAFPAVFGLVWGIVYLNTTKDDVKQFGLPKPAWDFTKDDLDIRP